MGVPAEQYEKVVAALKAGILKNGGHLDTGIQGTRFFFEMLADHGLNQLAFEAMNKRTEPSFGHWIELGSTTSRENWNENGSHNHPMFGGGLVWFYRNLAGMQADPENPGYRHIVFRPQPVEQLDHVTYTNETPYGEGGITWRREADIFTMDIKVPVGFNATVFVPSDDEKGVLEGGLDHRKASGIEFLREEEGYVVFNVGSGDYSFQVMTL